MTELLQHLQDLQLLESLSIKTREYEDRSVFYYNQIDSPKTHPLVMQCRGLMTNKERTKIICRPFDRFFNLGEAPDTQSNLDMTKAYAYEKIDGSLVKVYHYNGRWEIATRNTAFAESNVNGFDITFRELVLKALDCTEDQFQDKTSSLLDKSVTYLFEVTSLENRVVTPHTGYKLHYIGARFTETGVWCSELQVLQVDELGVLFPTKLKFDTKEQAIESANKLGGMREGFVLWQDGKPIAKIKADSYVTAHHIRGEGLSPKRIAELVLSGEHEEYLIYFPEDKEYFKPTTESLDALLIEIQNKYNEVKYTEDQKSFALAIKSLPYSAVLFDARKRELHPLIAFADSRQAYRVELLLSYHNKRMLPTP